MIIIYSSKSGSSAKYASILSSRTGLPSYRVTEEYPASENIVFIGWKKGSKVIGLDSIDRHRLVALCVVGIDRTLDSKALADELNISVPIYYLHGWIDRKEISLPDKLMLCFVCVMMKLKGLDDSNAPVFDAMMNGGSFFNESDLDGIARFLSQNLSKSNSVDATVSKT